MSALQSLFDNDSINLLDPAAVQANRMGQLTPEQEQWLNRLHLGGLPIRQVLPLLLVLPVLCFASSISLMDGLESSWVALPFFVLFLGIVLWRLGPPLWRGVRRAIRLRADRQSGLIRQAGGELTYGPDGYAAQVGERLLFLPTDGEAGGLLPGVRYTFFFFEESGMALSAEQVGSISAAAVRTGLNRILAAANRYTLDDLAVNQRGEIGNAQRGRLLGRLGVAVLLLLAFAGMALAVAFAFFLAPDLEAWPVWLFFLLIFGGVGFSVVRTFLNVVMDLRSEPGVVEGPGSRHTIVRRSGRASRRVYFYDVGATSFEVPQRAYKALLPGFAYRAYYAPHARTLLSIEVIEAPYNLS